MIEIETSVVIAIDKDIEMSAGKEMTGGTEVSVGIDIVRTAAEPENPVLAGGRAVLTDITASEIGRTRNAEGVVTDVEKTTATAVTAVAETSVTETTAVMTETPHRTVNAPYRRGESEWM